MHLNVYDSDAFSSVQLTSAVNERDYVPGFLGSLGIFREFGVPVTTVAIEKKGSTLKLIQTTARGAPPEQRTRDQADVRNLRVPRLAKEAVVTADQVQNVRPFGQETGLETAQNVLMTETDLINLEQDMTLENLRLGAVRGIILDADGSTIYNLFTEFGVGQPAEINFQLSVGTTQVRSKCTQLKRDMGKALKIGGMPFGVVGLCSDGFFDALINHDDVKRAYERWQDGRMLREGLAWSVFPFADINFVNYRGSDDGTSVGIEADKANFFATGVPGLFENPFAPADTMDFVNTMGLPRYMLQGTDPTGKNRQRSFEVQSNPLPYCTRPKSLLRATKG